MNITSLDGGIVQPEENSSSSFESWTQVMPNTIIVTYSNQTNTAKNPRQLDIAALTFDITLAKAVALATTHLPCT
jgi:hypothetical protein